MNGTQDDRNGAIIWIGRISATIGIFAALEALTQVGVISAVVFPPPSKIAVELARLLGTSHFWGDAGRTLIELVLSCVFGLPAGVIIGIALAASTTARDVFEPYLVTLYAIPTVVFYPILLALMGLGSGPIIAIAAFMVMVPVALNTIVAITGVSSQLIKLSRSLRCTPLQRIWKIVLPSSAPVLFAGVKLGIMYGIVGTISMEFILADKGIGFRVGNEYNNFAILSMWAHIAVIVVFAMAISAALDQVERRLRMDLQ